MPCIITYLLLVHIFIASLMAKPLPITNHTSSTSLVTPRSYFTPIRPLEISSPVECHNEADFRGHADIEPKFFFDGVYKFCQQRYATMQTLDYTDDPTYNNGHLVRNASWRYRDWHGVNHDFRVWWEAGCRVSGGKQSVHRPLGEEGGPEWTPGCYEIMGSTYYECTGNGGVGGRKKAGCLIYEYKGGKGDNDDPAS
ncbi:hypothetical protein CSAL01_11786 [Colletotrichum salicis]|uniref:Ecp2 effector protein domain-containing protein n=1 Tax=Colletotrichum salicis TaxID=1209931 RepID=A0A135S3V4_9PEZI|nr:hypothetical protein CSAL01_11786 [Colletotrichum salicis]